MEFVNKFNIPVATDHNTENLVVDSLESMKKGKIHGTNVTIIESGTQIVRNLGTYWNGFPDDGCFLSFNQEGNVTFLGNIWISSLKRVVYLKDFDKVIDGVPYQNHKKIMDKELVDQIHLILRTELVKKLRLKPIKGHTVILYNNGQMRLIKDDNQNCSKGYKIEMIEEYDFKELEEGFYELTIDDGAKNEAIKRVELNKQHGFRYFGNIMYEEGLMKQDNNSVWAQEKDGNIIFVGKFLSGMRHGYGVSFPKGIKVTENIKFLSKTKKQVFGRWHANNLEEQLNSEWDELIQKTNTEEDKNYITFNELMKFLEVKNYSTFGTYEFSLDTVFTAQNPIYQGLRWVYASIIEKVYGKETEDGTNGTEDGTIIKLQQDSDTLKEAIQTCKNHK